MGVEYRRYLIPRPNTYRPDIGSALSLVTALRAQRWIVDDEAHHSARTTGAVGILHAPMADLLRKFDDWDALVSWSIESLTDSGLRYPLEPPPFDDAAGANECYYRFELHFARDFIDHVSEVIDGFDPPPRCPKGHDVRFEPQTDEDPFYASRLAAACRVCGGAFDPTRLIATGRNGWTGDRVQIQGGATYRFAVVVDCGKNFRGQPMHFHPELKALVEKTLGVTFYEVEDFY